jgi:hypothetical protein
MNRAPGSIKNGGARVGQNDLRSAISETDSSPVSPFFARPIFRDRSKMQVANAPMPYHFGHRFGTFLQKNGRAIL